MRTSPISSVEPAALVLPDLVEGRVVSDMLTGARCAWAAFGIVVRDPRLRALSLLPMLVQLLCFAACGAFAYSRFDDVTRACTPAPESPWAWASVVVGPVVAVALAVASFAVGLVVASVVNDPFFDLISERTEELVVGHAVSEPLSGTRILRGILRESFATTLRLAAWCTLGIPLTVLGFTPAALVAYPLGMAWTWMFLAYEFVARSLVRHAVTPSGRFAPMFAHKALFCGFGAAASLIASIPFTSPFLVVGGTRMYLCLAAHGRAPTRFSSPSPGRLQ